MQLSAQNFVDQLDLLIHSLCFWTEDEGGVHNPQTNLCCFCNTARVRLMNMLMKLQWEFWHYFITSPRLESNNTMGLHVFRNCCRSKKKIGPDLFIMPQKLQSCCSKIMIIILYVRVCNKHTIHTHNSLLLRSLTAFHVSVFWHSCESVFVNEFSPLPTSQVRGEIKNGCNWFS